MKKKVLFTPGPTITPKKIQRAFFDHSLHHRTSDYHLVYEAAKRKVRKLFGAPSADVLFYPSVGTPMMEIVLHAFLAPGENVVSVNTGFFGAKWAEIASDYNAEVIEIKSELGETYPHENLHLAVREHLPRLVLMQAADTQTGIRNDTFIGHAIRSDSPNTYFAVDAILEAGTSPIKMEEEGIDVLVAAGQKSFLLPPGLGIIILSPRATSWLKRTKKRYPGFFFDIRKEINAQRECHVRFTMPVNHIYALNAVLEKILEGEAEWYAECAKRAKRIRKELGKLGFPLFTEGPASNGISVFRVPPDCKVEHILNLMENKEEFLISPGLGENYQTVIRIAHFAGTKPFVNKFIQGFRRMKKALDEARNEDAD